MRNTKQNRKQMSLRAKMNSFVFLNALVGLALVTGGYAYMLVQNTFHDKGEQALTVAETVASMPAVVDAFRTADPATTIQPIAEQIRRQTGAEFVVVGNMQRIRYSHPNPAQIGKTMVGNDDNTVLHGQTSISEAVGTLGLSVRGKAPIFDHGKQVGIVSVGYLVNRIWNQIFLSMLKILLLGLAGLAVSMVGAHLLSKHVKRQIFDMEPDEIAFLTQEQTAILQSINDGILAVDQTGRIKACNRLAAELLGVAARDVTGRRADEVIAHSGLSRLISEGPDYVEQPMILGDNLVLANRVPVQLSGEVIGLVVTFRDKQQLDQINHRLSDIIQQAEALRSQRHEFMNRLHTISGLIRLREYDMVLELIDAVNDEQNKALSFFATRIHDPAVVGTLMGKMHRARELGIELIVDTDSHLGDPCPYRETVVTVLGNAIENAMEELVKSRGAGRTPTIVVTIKEDQQQLLVTVRDSGSGIHPSIGERVFEDGVSTKGPGRGFGLSLCAKLVRDAKGKLAIVSSPEGATLELVIPKGSVAS